VATITAHDSAAPGVEQVWTRPRVDGLVLGVGLLATGWAVLFAWLAVTRHLSGGSHAEDLGFTDQVIANFLRGQWFRMSAYAGAAAWNTELDLSHLARPDSLLAFHVEPMLLLFVPLYALGGDVVWLLVIQAVAVGLGALPAFVLARRWSGSKWVGGAVAMAYLLSPLGQWAVLSDFHTSTLAAPLLVFAVERLSAGRQVTGLALAALALSAREDVGPVVAGLGVLATVKAGAFGVPPTARVAAPRAGVSGSTPAARGLERRRLGTCLVGVGVAWTVVCVAVLRAYSGGAVSPFADRYAAILANGLPAVGDALSRPADLGYLWTLVVSGAWLGVLAPLALLPSLPSLAINLLSSSPWMASGRAHYSGLVLPWVVVAASAALASPRVWRLRPTLAASLVASSGLAYVLAGAGPLGGDYAPAEVTAHARLANALAASIPQADAVSASASLVPHVSRRARVYVFPAVLDADAVLIDVTASPGPTSAGDVYLHVRDMLAGGGWSIGHAEDGVLLLERDPEAPPTTPDDLPPEFFSFVRTADGASSGATLVPSPDGAIEPDGPRGILRTSWRVVRQPAPGANVQFDLTLSDGQTLRVWDVAPLWWYPPERWAPGQVVTVDVPNVPIQQFRSWQPIVSGF
jgi:uncharacterized membrane protein